MTERAFASSQQFQQLFIDGLHRLATIEKPGVFILVLANACLRAEIYQHLKDELRDQFNKLEKLISQNTEQQNAAIAPDDLAVFRQLVEKGLENLPVSQHRYLQHWQLQFNPLRSLRPARNSEQNITCLLQDFNSEGFHFNKAFLDDEVLWRGMVQGIDLKLMYNKFPFADFHALALLHPQQEKPQHLTHEDINQMQTVLTELNGIDGLGAAYNSLGAFASINHQHWHIFVSDKKYPIELQQWQHSGGQEAYPLAVKTGIKLSELWEDIMQSQMNNQAFNLFIRPQRVYLISRRLQGSYQHENWTGGFAWCEVSGSITATQKKDFENLQAEDIQAEMEKVR